MFSLLDQCSSPHPYLTVPACYRPGIRSSLFAPVPVHPPQDETSYFPLLRIYIPFSVYLVSYQFFDSSALLLSALSAILLFVPPEVKYHQRISYLLSFIL